MYSSELVEMSLACSCPERISATDFALANIFGAGWKQPIFYLERYREVDSQSASASQSMSQDSVRWVFRPVQTKLSTMRKRYRRIMCKGSGWYLRACPSLTPMMLRPADPESVKN